MESLLYAKEACEQRVKHLQGIQGAAAPATAKSDNIPLLPMRFVMKNSTTMTYFQEYMTEKNALHVLDCWAAIAHWRNKAVRAKAKANKVCACMQLHLAPRTCVPSWQEDVAYMAELNKRITSAALKIFYQYLADEAGESQVLPILSRCMHAGLTVLACRWTCRWRMWQRYTRS